MVPRSFNDTRLYKAVLFISIVRMPFQAPTPKNADSLFAPVTTPGFYLPHIEVADKDPASRRI